MKPREVPSKVILNFQRWLGRGVSLHASLGPKDVQACSRPSMSSWQLHGLILRCHAHI